METCEYKGSCFDLATEDIKYIEDEAFRGCVSMKKPWIPKNIKGIGETAFDHPDWRRF